MRTPDQKGHGAEAWVITIPKTVKPHGTVKSWLVKGEKFHMLWNHWAVSLIHLRPYEGEPQPPILNKPNMTHEVLIFALNPGEDQENRRVYDPDNFPVPTPYMRPIDLSEQFEAPSDEKATEVVDLMVRAICDGIMSPDQDFRSVWKEVVAATAAHIRGECPTDKEKNADLVV